MKRRFDDLLASGEVPTSIVNEGPIDYGVDVGAIDRARRRWREARVIRGNEDETRGSQP
jgi:hypothetical protein